MPAFLPPDPRVEEPYRVTPQMALRIAILGVVAIVLFFALFFRLWALQVISGDRYLEDAKNNQVRTARIPAPRGTVVDRNGTVLVSNQPGTQVRLWPAALDEVPLTRRRTEFRELSKLLGLPMKDIRLALARGRADPLTPVALKTSVRDFKVNYILEHQRRFPGIQITTVQLRNYEQGTLAAQMLGSVGQISPEQLKTREQQGYAGGDVVGQTGLEATYDRYLRGQPGVSQVRVDALGRITSGQEFSQLPQPGYSVKLTLDAGLQRVAEDAIRYGIRRARTNGDVYANGGALIAMDPRDGEILAMASNPTYDPKVYVGRVSERALKRLGDPRENYPTLDRAVAGLYPPGSTFKPVTALAALQERLVGAQEPILCSPDFTVKGQTFKNWDPTSSQSITLAAALGMSCDTYFYRLAMRFYERPDSLLQKWARQMGLARPTGVDLGPESKGLIPTPAWRHQHFTSAWDRVWRPGDSIQLAIGQGDVLATPLQMTRIYAMIGNGGKLVQPHVLQQVEEPGANGQDPVVVRSFKPPPARDVGLDPNALRVVQEGLLDATHASFGTTEALFGSFGVTVAGKTGTAEKVVKLPGYPNGKLLDQSWWCGYAPADAPKLAVCAVIENGGFGSAAAAPTAMKVFAKYFNVPEAVVSTVKAD